jgi:signal transduction histidine kinase
MAHAALRRARILECLSDDELEGMSMLGEVRAFGQNESVFRGDEPADSLFIVLEGQVSSLLKEKGQSFELAQCEPGDHFGQVALLGGQLCYTSAVGRSRGRVFVLSSMGCAALLARIPRSGTQSLRPSRPSGPSDTLDLPVHAAARNSSEPDFLRIRSISSAVAGVAHELNTPLGVIENAASFVYDQLSADAIAEITSDDIHTVTLKDIAEACALIRKNVAHAANIVSSFKKLSIGQLADTREKVDLLRVVQQVLGLFRTKALSALPPGMNTHGQSGAQRLMMPGSRLDVDIQCELNDAQRVWEGFPSLFSRVLLNLLTNIDRYAYPGFADGGRVEIRLAQVERQVGRPEFVVTVSDFGRGIPERDLPRIFDPFFTTGRTQGGTGLGLAMVHNLVTHGFGGSVHVRSSVGQGTTFELTFPTQAPHHSPESHTPP